jgi:hypothetical protein
MKRPVKAFSLLLVIALLSALMPTFVRADTDDQPVQQQIDVMDISGKVKVVTVYDRGGTVVMSVDDIAAYTRCDVTVSGSAYTLSHASGRVTLTIDMESGIVTENNATGSQILKTAMSGDTALVEAYPVLTYFGAECVVDEENSFLGIFMPEVTFWEAAVYYLYGDGADLSYYTVTTDQDATIYLNNVTLLITGDHLYPTDAAYSALELDLPKYASVSTYRQERVDSFNNTILSFSEALGLAKNLTDISEFIAYSKVTEHIIKNFGSFKTVKDLKTGMDTFKRVSQAHSDFVDASKNAGQAIDALCFAADTFSTMSERFNIGQGTKDAFINTFSNETVRLSGAADLDSALRGASREVSATISSSGEIVFSSIYEEGMSFLTEKIKTGAVKIAFGSLAGLSYELGIAVTKIIAEIPGANYTPFIEGKKAEASLKAIYSAGYYLEARKVFVGLLNQADSENWRNLNTIQKLRDSYIIMLRFLLLNHESNIEYGEYNNYWGNYTEKLNEAKSKADELALALEKTEHTTALIMPEFEDLKDLSKTFNTQVLALPPASHSDSPGSVHVTGPASGDWVNIVSVTPARVIGYANPLEFVVVVNYSLESVESGIVYLGFNYLEPYRYTLVAEQVVPKGSGQVTLVTIVLPAGWGTPDSPNGPTKGGLEALEGLTFDAYVNISENPHPDSWNPLATDTWTLS